MRLNETSPSKFARASAATLMGRRRHNRKALLCADRIVKHSAIVR